MAYVAPHIRPIFDAIPPHLREEILALGTRLDSKADLLGCLERTRRQHKN